MLLSIMYHRVGKGKHANSLAAFRKHLSFFKENYPLVLPGDPLQPKKLSLCLTFDDATYDFYHFIFPLLKEFRIRAVLGVPVHYILERSDLPPSGRLEIPYSLMMQEGIFETKAPFCTWEELKEMVESGFVEVASHSLLHCNLTFNFVNLRQEVVQSKERLEEKLTQAVSTFIYPFGRVTPRVHEYVRGHYSYAFRIGSAINFGWGQGKQPLSRICGDQIEDPVALLSPLRLCRFIANRLF